MKAVGVTLPLHHCVNSICPKNVGSDVNETAMKSMRVNMSLGRTSTDNYQDLVSEALRRPAIAGVLSKTCERGHN